MGAIRAIAVNGHPRRLQLQGYASFALLRPRAHLPKEIIPGPTHAKSASALRAVHTDPLTVAHGHAQVIRPEGLRRQAWNEREVSQAIQMAWYQNGRTNTEMDSQAVGSGGIYTTCVSLDDAATG